MPIDTNTRQRVAELLGREPRGLRDIAVVSAGGDPSVIRVASVVDGKPFPTLYWLTDPALSYQIDQDEAGGLIGVFQSRVDAEPSLQAAMARDHRAYMAERDKFLQPEEREFLEQHGLMPALAERGIGGIADFTRIRCLHTWYAAHLVAGNTIGSMLDDHWQQQSGAGGGLLNN